MIRKIFTALFTLLFTASIPAAFADDAQLMSMLEKMQKQMAQMQSTINSQNQKISMLENRPASGGSMAEPTPPMTDYEFKERLNGALGGADKWLKDVKFNADTRLRYEAFDYTHGTLSETDPRNRFRYRLRFGFEKKFSPDMKVGFGLASGSTTDPTSTNETLDGNFTFKTVTIEKVFAQYNPSWAKFHDSVKNVEFAAGKMNNPFERGSSDIIWDRDVKPEGIYEMIEFDLYDGENVDLSNYVLAGQFILDEDGTLGSQTAGGDAELYAFQTGLNAVVYTPMLERPVDLLSAFSFYNFADYARQGNFGAFARGNTNVTGLPSELDAKDFNIVESYNEIAIYPMGLPLRFYFDAATNVNDKTSERSVKGEHFAYALGTKIGGLNKAKDWEFQYAYKYIDDNAVVGAFNDSDFGDGHSGKRGSVFKLGYMLTDQLSLNTAAIFANNVSNGTAGILDQEQRRFQVDLSWKW